MSDRCQEYRRTEYLLLILVLVLKLYLLLSQWGVPQGFDIDHFLTVLDYIRMSPTYPGVRDCYNCYHPPLGFLMVMLLKHLTGNGITAAELLSALSMMGIILSLRLILKHTGLLHTLFGVFFLYFTAGLPLFVFLSWEVSFETVSFLWTVLTLLISVELLWGTPVSHRRGAILTLALTGVLALGMYTKFPGILNFCIPFVVLCVRAQSRSSFRAIPVLLLSCVLAALIASPLYYYRYYQTEGKIFPINMEWTGGEIEMEMMYKRREMRDQNPLAFFFDIVRTPSFSPGSTEPDNSSFWNVAWFHTWKQPFRLRDNRNISPPILSDIYIYLFLLPVLLGTLLFLKNFQKHHTALSDFGMILLVIGFLFCAAQLRIAFLFPAWAWAVMKAKYIAPAILWVPFTVAYCAQALSTRWQHMAFHRQYILVCMACLTIFLILNHVIPIY